jgi:dual specificity phosphatase 12
MESIPAQDPQSGIVHMRIPVEDAPHADLLAWLPHACRFIEDALQSGGIVLVHGVHGLSRGATVMAAYCEYRLPYICLANAKEVMWSRRISPTEALDVVRRREYISW